MVYVDGANTSVSAENPAEQENSDDDHQLDVPRHLHVQQVTRNAASNIFLRKNAKFRMLLSR